MTAISYSSQESRKRSKAVKSAFVVLLAVILAISGTFALAQVFLTENATNELNDKVSADAGGRLHDEFSGPDRLDASGAMDKNIYAERFVANGEKNAKVWVRIQLKEYMEAKTPGGTAAPIVSGTTKGNVSSWSVVDPTTKGTEKATVMDGYRTLTYGSSTTGGYYMPTLNRLYSGNVTEGDYTNISADVKGALADNYAGYKSYKDYTASDVLNTGELVSEDGATVQKTDLSATPLHVEPLPATAGVRAWTNSMTKAAGNWYYYDGWFYWSNELTLGEKDSVATGLLLDSVKIESEQLFGKEYYYGLDAKADFFTDSESFTRDDNGNLTLPDGKGGNKVVDQTLYGLLSQLGCMNVGGSSLPATPSVEATTIEEFQTALAAAPTANDIDAMLTNVEKGCIASYDDALVSYKVDETTSHKFYVVGKDSDTNPTKVLVLSDIVYRVSNDRIEHATTGAIGGGVEYSSSNIASYLSNDYYKTVLPQDVAKKIVKTTVNATGPGQWGAVKSITAPVFAPSSADAADRMWANIYVDNKWFIKAVDTLYQKSYYTHGSRSFIPSSVAAGRLLDGTAWSWCTRNIVHNPADETDVNVITGAGKLDNYANKNSYLKVGARPMFWISLDSAFDNGDFNIDSGGSTTDPN